MSALGPEYEDRPITIVIHTPVSVDDINKVLRAVADCWPTAKIDTTHPEGWRIEVGGPDRMTPRKGFE